MNQVTFKAFALVCELDLTRLAGKFGISRKYRWEEPMRLDPAMMLPDPDGDQQVYLYYFGGVVFLNCPDTVIASFLDCLLARLDVGVSPVQLPYHEEYLLDIVPGCDSAITNDRAVMPRYNQQFLDIVCFVIAKSVALERIEERLDTVFDEVETLVTNLGRGKLELPDRDMARLAASILSFKITSLAHIMVLDKPDTTWDDPEADRLYTTMAGLFELQQRYQEIKHKSETLLDMTDVFTTLSHARRAARLEWIIIVLIAIEIVIYLVQLMTPAK